MTPTRLAAITLVALLALGCDPGVKNGEASGGSETSGSEGDGDGDGDEGPGPCGVESVTVLGDLDVVPTAFDQTVNEMLADVVGSYTGTYTWYEDDGPVSVAHAGTSSPLSMSVSYAGGEVRLVEVELHGQFPGGQDGGSPCSNHLEVDAELEFATEDGLFAESMAVTLETDAIGTGELGLRHELDFATHQGTLELADFSFTDAEILGLELGASFGGAGASGGLGMEVLITELDVVGFGGVASFNTLLEGANSLCGTCVEGEFCRVWESASELDTQTAYECMAIPDPCVAMPDCACLEAEVCPDFFVACSEGEVSTLGCASG